MAGLSLLYLPSDGSQELVHEQPGLLSWVNRPPRRRPCGVAILVVEHDDADSIRRVQDAFANFPIGMVDSVASDSVIQLPQPEGSAGAASVGIPPSSCSVLQFQGLDGDSVKYSNGYNATPDEISKDAKSITTVGTWISRDAVVTDSDNATLVLLIIRPNSKHIRRVADRLEEWFQQHPLDLCQMRENPLFIYIALYYCFNNFTTILFQYENVYNKVVSPPPLRRVAWAGAVLIRSWFQQNVKILKEDLEDFKTKLDILTERMQVTLDLSVFSVVETDPLYFFIASMLTLVVSLGVVMWLYNSVMHLGQGLRRRDLNKLMYHLPYDDKLGFPTTASSDTKSERATDSPRLPNSRVFESQYSRRRSRRHSHHYTEEGTHGDSESPRLGSSVSSDSQPRPPPPVPGMAVPPQPAWSETPGRMAAPHVVSVSPRISARRKHTAQLRKQSKMGSLSYSRRPTASTLPRQEHSTSRHSAAYGPPPPPPMPRGHESPQYGYESHDGGPSSSHARPDFSPGHRHGREGQVRIVLPGAIRETQASVSPPPPPSGESSGG
ncbi:hypothetical protein S40293_11443 [Stachybotrys chartarum IBT 40293]|nr:hypothetical protein S40293_11443 [Stachybotrys chartarum IBT 40293]